MMTTQDAGPHPAVPCDPAGARAVQAATGSGRMPLPAPRGPVSEALLTVLTGAVDDPRAVHRAVAGVLRAPPPSWALDEDVQLTLLCMYELHYLGLDGVADDWEWNPDVLGAREKLERPFEVELRAAAGPVRPLPTDRQGVAAALFALVEQDTAPSVARRISRDGTLEQVRELLVLKSVYQLKEADPHTWAIPRLAGDAKAGLVEIQADEYGGGDPERMHAALFARAMRGVGLDDTYGRYVDLVPAAGLAPVNVMSMFGLHRRLRGALAGDLAAIEMTSSLPSRLYANGLRRLGLGVDVTGYFDEHVEADAVHEQIAARDLAGALVEAEPALAGDVLAGAAAALAVDGWAAERMLACWDAGATALRGPVA